MSDRSPKLLEAFAEDAREAPQGVHGGRLLQRAAGREILDAPDETRAAVAVIAVQELCPSRGAIGRLVASLVRKGEKDLRVELALGDLVEALLRDPPPFSAEQLEALETAVAQGAPRNLGHMVRALVRDARHTGGETPERLLEALAKDAREAEGGVYGDGLLAREAGQAILQSPPEIRAAVTVLAVKELCPPRGMMGRLLASLTWRGSRDYRVEQGLRSLVSRLLRARLPFSDEQLAAMAAAVNHTADFGPIPPGGLVRALERRAETGELSPKLREQVAGLRRTFEEGLSEEQKLVSRVLALLGESGAASVVEPGIWGDDVLAWLGRIDARQRAAWDALLEHAAGAAGKSRPTQRWARQAPPLVEAVGADAFAERLAAWMEGAKLGWTRTPDWGGSVDRGMSDRNQDLLKGLIWAAASLDDESLAHAIGRFGERCYRKIPNFGAGSKRLGNACLHALSEMPDGKGVAHLSRLAGKVRYASGRAQVERALEGAAQRAGQTREDIEELAVPDFGLDADGVYTQQLGEHTAEIAILDGAEVKLGWLKADGKRQKSVPKAVKETHPAELKALKKRVKEIKDVLSGQAARLQRLYLLDRRLPLSALRARYLDHPLTGQLARRLLWMVRHGDQGAAAGAASGRGEGGGRPRRAVAEAPNVKETEVMWRDGDLVTLGGEKVELPDQAEARLWHVLDVDTDDPDGLQRLLVWRDYLEEQRIRQPFKQLWREVYRPQDPKANVDRRFDGHIVRQHPFLNLCQQRGWQYTIQGYWDSANLPSKQLPRWDITVSLEVEPLDHKRDDYIFNYLITGGVQFTTALDKVPPIVFSEVMRDVDLFVGVATVANDPEWDAAGIKQAWSQYWHEAAWGSLAPVARTRRAVLERVLPRTTLNEQAQLEDRWLAVRGSRGSYRIHLGTANVRRQGDDKPLAVVPDRRAKNHVASVFLPFEGDGMLTTILAKAFLLAEDERLDLR
jgi:hypothetical protein